ncbi:energy transducer TonB family protein [Aestuariibaculum suncheonense]|uniref:Energy transducer TonB n=1 Tax=Aestuariibaculum suncheonense TaxID=1028745 RepID=A0A8J6Q9Y9_9FLAO|nr:energy transducer TonB [Aestuariibaculum suncheonense]MBD0834078.1 energy transducer TonB [Aestuariibaculum suncheonense]
MRLTDQHKALLITLLIAGTVLLFVFNLHLKRQNELVAESYYEMEPEEELTKEEIKVLEALEQLQGSKAETNQAFNETDNSKHFAQAYKTIAPPEDYVPKTNTSTDTGDSDNTNAIGENFSKDKAIKEEELSAFNKVSELLKKQKSEGVNKKSTMSYSLKGRTHNFMPTPIYLCEEGGKIVVNITVNAQGTVTDASVNGSSTSDNQCLKEHALEYAREATFSEDPSKPSQVGTITFNFIGKP